MRIQFEKKTVVVSGAAGGIGKAIAEEFASLRASVSACDIKAESLADLEDAGIAVESVDLSDREAAAAWIGRIEARCGGAVDVLVNCAGGVAGQTGRALEDVSDAEWDAVMAINLGAAFALSRACVPAMKRARRGCIVNITSGAATKASLTGIQAYCATKHALLGLTRQLAHELGPHGIRVNSVAPGLMLTNEATRRQWAAYGADGQKALLEGVALRRLGSAQDIVNAVTFLASDLSGFITGQHLQVDGGR
ncbi:MAG TPA: SDR family NAD(P)-dependent oxidoreductase [Steroidobacteraceae bacterium]|nr:SDR family NAD(P)-dependent oxidoreductase [Steroidobacteraceae bacterium]